MFPHCGRLAMFWSHLVPHEVMPSFADRHAVTTWFYDALEHAEALAGAKVRCAIGWGSKQLAVKQ